MTLKDFFTSTELKDGLTSPTRVNELLTVMQNEKERIIDNIGEATRQWSAVATAIATTENKECLDLFVQLDGLWFIDKWLNEAPKLINDTGDGSLEELSVALLGTLERVQVDHHWSVGPGIRLTVQGLLSHSSLVVREKAKALCDKWTPVQHIDTVASDVNSVASSPRKNDDGNNLEQSGDQNMDSVCSDSGQQETGKHEMPSEDVVMDLQDPVENEKSKSKSNDLTGISSPFEDVNEKQVTLTSNTEVDNKTEIIGANDKDKDMMGGEESPDHRNAAVESNVTSGIGDFNGGGSQELSGSENPKTTSNTESDKGNDDEKENVGTESEGDSGNRSRFPKRSLKINDSDLISKRPSDMELDYGMVDPLELARQVANEVEQEVDSQEESCSTSTTEKEQLDGGSDKEVSSGTAPNPAPGPSVKISSSPSEPMNHGKTLELPTTQISEMVQESAPNAEKGFSGFDLNEEISCDEIDYPMDPFSTPISIVSASRAAVADGLPLAPLQFEGTLGWKGSAATSAFRRIPEPEKTFSSSSSHNYSNQRLNRLDFDLNVSDSSDDKIEDFLSRDKMHVTSYLPFRDEHEQEPSTSMKSDRLQLDLNSLGDSDNGIVSLNWNHGSRVASLRQNRPQSPSVSSSSSSMQPSFRNMDLNLNNYSKIPNNASFDNPFLGKLRGNKREEPVISTLHTQVEVNHKEFIPPLQPNGRFFDPSFDFSLGRPGSGSGLGSSMPYANLPSYGYGHNGFSMGPMYGPPGATIPYTVDLRGIPSIPPAFSHQTHPFIFNNMTAPSGSTGAGPSCNNFDLNSGFITERVNNGSGLRQFLSNDKASSSSVIGGKREEPDSGWELFPVNYKHQQPPWQ